MRCFFPTMFCAILVNFKQILEIKDLLSARRFSFEESILQHLIKSFWLMELFEDWHRTIFLQRRGFSGKEVKTVFNPFPHKKILDSSKLKEFAGDNFKFDENGRKFSKQVERTEGKGEIAHNKQLLLSPRCFLSKDLYYRNAKNRACLGKG